MPGNVLSYGGFKRVKGDASRVDTNSKGQLALLVPTSDRDLHFASAADEATDWNVANPDNPTLFIHSETTPATDYGQLSHDATDFLVESVGGNIQLRPPAASDVNILNGASKLMVGTRTAFATTQPTNAIQFKEGTQAAGTVATSTALMANATVLRKIIADGTVSNVET